MYKPTLYLTMEADPAHYNPEGDGLAARLWSFTAPVVLAPSPSGELGLKARMKCAGRPYWNSDDVAQNENWEQIARPYLADKIASITDVFEGINVKRYNHYSGSLHFSWLKLDLAPYEIRLALDSDAKDADFVPDVMAWTDTVRSLVNTPEFAAFETNVAEIAKENGESGPITVFVPSRAEVEARRALRAEEAEAWAAWTAQQEQLAKSESEETENTPGEIDEYASDTATMEPKTAEAVTTEEAEESAEPEEPMEEPVLSGALEVHTLEFISHDGTSLFYDVAAKSWK